MPGFLMKFHCIGLPASGDVNHSTFRKCFMFVVHCCKDLCYGYARVPHSSLMTMYWLSQKHPEICSACSEKVKLNLREITDNE